MVLRRVALILAKEMNLKLGCNTLKHWVMLQNVDDMNSTGNSGHNTAGEYSPYHAPLGFRKPRIPKHHKGQGNENGIRHYVGCREERK